LTVFLFKNRIFFDKFIQKEMSGVTMHVDRFLFMHLVINEYFLRTYKAKYKKKNPKINNNKSEFLLLLPSVSK